MRRSELRRMIQEVLSEARGGSEKDAVKALDGAMDPVYNYVNGVLATGALDGQDVKIAKMLSGGYEQIRKAIDLASTAEKKAGR